MVNANVHDLENVKVYVDGKEMNGLPDEGWSSKVPLKTLYVVKLENRYVQSYDIVSDITATTRLLKEARKFDSQDGASTIATFVGGHVEKISK